jgi:hypothetical protein
MERQMKSRKCAWIEMIKPLGHAKKLPQRHLGARQVRIAALLLDGDDNPGQPVELLVSRQPASLRASTGKPLPKTRA